MPNAFLFFSSRFIKSMISFISSATDCFSGMSCLNAFERRVRFRESCSKRLSRNSSASSITSISVKGFLPIDSSDLYFAELKIVTSASK